MASWARRSETAARTGSAFHAPLCRNNGNLKPKDVPRWKTGKRATDASVPRSAECPLATAHASCSPPPPEVQNRVVSKRYLVGETWRDACASLLSSLDQMAEEKQTADEDNDEGQRSW